ncbi:MAG: CotH kinase family protein [Bacteroidaceae bacterium]|nr:CotH kinase family protein [Bacteroidaceae bacterium]
MFNKSIFKNYIFIIIILFYSCSNTEKEDIPIPQIKSFMFLMKDNPQYLSEDIVGTIKNNQIILRIPHILSKQNLIPTIKLSDEQYSWIKEDITLGFDFSSPVEITIENKNGETQTYEIIVYAFTGLPIVYIDTENNESITSKDRYLNANIQIIEDIYTRSEKTFKSNVKIKGRGNSTWTLPKKPYALKFDKKTSILGEPANKSWVLLANYTDKTNLRNETAFFMGRISNLDWTPRSHFVELFINNIYYGTYQICDKINISDSRVNISDNGYLLEVDNPTKIGNDDITFRTERLLFCIKDPDIEKDSERYQEISNHIKNIETVLFGDNFLDKDNGYAKYIDKTSFVDWYLINEITKNNDTFYSSSFMNISPDGKLKMGPLWDYDISLGNINYNNNQSYEGFYAKNTIWIARMFEDPEFVSLVKDRFNYFKSKKNDIFININDNADYLKYSVVENNNKSQTLYKYTWPNYAIWGSYNNEVQYLKNWIEKRFNWLESAFSNL